MANDEWRTNLTLEETRELRELLSDTDAPYVGYLLEDLDETSAAHKVITKWEQEKSDRANRPGELLQWLSNAEKAIKLGNTPPEPSSKYIDEDGHSYSKCLGCGTTYRDDTERPCSCPVNVETVHPDTVDK